jgi:hypothetical protein
VHLRATTKPTVCWEANRTGLTWEAWIWFTEPADKLFCCLCDCRQANNWEACQGKRSRSVRNIRYKAGELYYGCCLMSIVISTFRKEYSSFVAGATKKGKGVSEAGLCPYRLRPKVGSKELSTLLLAMVSSTNSFPALRKGGNFLRLPDPLFSAKRVSRNESQRKRI